VSSPPSHLRLVEPQPEAAGGQTPEAAPIPTFNEIFRRYSSYVAAIGLRLLGRVEEIEDLVQDVFIAAHRGLHGLREPGALKGWLATVTVRVARRRLRARRVRMMLRLAPVYDYELLAQPGLSPEDATMLAQVYALLDDLPVGERLAWSLRHLEGERLERIAEITGASLATVKRRISAAAARLQERMDG
jgi:RNA polymerase sigma-70 factor (ECF subfamily)